MFVFFKWKSIVNLFGSPPGLVDILCPQFGNMEIALEINTNLLNVMLDLLRKTTNGCKS